MNSLEELPRRLDALTVEVSDLRKEMREGFSAVRGEMAAQGESLRWHTDQGLAELRTHLLVLHEEVLDKISRIGEGRRSRRKR